MRLTTRATNSLQTHGRTVTVNGAENYFSILKRGIYGVYHSVSEAHLHRYLAEFDFRYSNRSKLGIEDTERFVKAVMGAEGKRLTYRRPANNRGPEAPPWIPSEKPGRRPDNRRRKRWAKDQPQTPKQKAVAFLLWRAKQCS